VFFFFYFYYYYFLLFVFCVCVYKDVYVDMNCMFCEVFDFDFVFDVMMKIDFCSGFNSFFLFNYIKLFI
jgi:hypothetical protein